MPNITESICTGNDRYKKNEPLSPMGVVLHSVGTPQPAAEVFTRRWQANASQFLTHYVLDDTDIYHTMPDDRKCHHVGSPGNGKWLGIEMCEPKQIRYTGGAAFTVSDKAAAQDFASACYRNAVWLLAKLCREHGWNPETAILTHGEVTKKKLSNTTHADPEHLWNGLGLPYSLQTLREDVALAMGKPVADKPAVPARPRMDPAASFQKSLAGTYTVTADFLNVRAGAGTDKQILTALPEGARVKNYGYFTRAKNGTRWLYVAFPQGEGFCSEKYLQKG